MILTEIAKQYLHVREGKVNNIGKEIQMFQTATWLTPGGWAWCSAVMCWVLKEALTNQSYHSYIKSRYKGAEDPEKWRCRDASAFGWIKWAAQLQPLHKDKILFDEKEVAKQDDLVIYDFSHIGVVIENQIQLGFNLHTIEGNTQPKTAQRDGTGDGVYEMYRKPNLVKNYIRL